MNGKYIESINQVMDNFGYIQKESIACNGSDEYLILDNEVIFTVVLNKSLGDSIVSSLKTQLESMGANISFLSNSEGVLYKYIININ